MRKLLLGHGQREKRHDRGLAALFVVGLWMFLSVFFDFYYDLNDDTAMKDILSGTYTGVPDGHNIQMLYPLGWCISMLYKMLPRLPWYGVFLCGCQFFSVWIALCTLLPYLSEKKTKRSWLLFFTAAIGSLFLYEFIFVQYTVTAGLLAAAAILRLLMSPDVSKNGFWKYHSVTVFLIVLSFYLRTEMLLLLSPFLALAGLFRIWKEQPDQKKRAWRNYLLLASGILLLMEAGLLADRAAYGSREWRSFRQFFDDRTSVYDFYGIPDYETNKVFYEQIGLSKEGYTLLLNYNFDLDEEIDTETMAKIAAYAAENQQQSVFYRMYLSVYTYFYRFVHGQEILFDVLAAISYFFLCKAALKRKRADILGKLALLFGLRTLLWLFLLYRGRVPERITHPLYLAELILLLGMFLSEGNVLQWKKYEKSAILSMYILLFVCTAVYHGQAAVKSYEVRGETNLQWQQWKEYCKAHLQQFYYLDVYSTVAYSEKLFSDVSPDYRNFDLAGGWCSKSPLAEKKRKVMGFENAKDGLLSGKAMFVAAAENPERSPEFLVSWYQEKGKEIALEETDRCGSFAIFRIIEKQ